MKNTLHSRFQVKAFTLIELLVVVAIIALLAAILFPVFSRARENARKTSCQSNLKQIGLGLLQYSQDFDEALVKKNYGPSESYSRITGNYKWMDAIFPYVKSDQIFNCPSDPPVAPPYDGNLAYIHYQDFPTTKSVGYGAGNNGAYGSYAINAYYGSGGGGAANQNFMSELSDAANTIWVVDAYRINNTYPEQSYEICFGQNDSRNFFPTKQGQCGLLRFGGCLVQRHLEMTNVVFTDGHVKALKQDELTKKSTTGNNAYKYFSVDQD